MEGALEEAGLDMRRFQRKKQVKAFIKVGGGQGAAGRGWLNGIVGSGFAHSAPWPLELARAFRQVAPLLNHGHPAMASILRCPLVCSDLQKLPACPPAAWGGPGVCHRCPVQV
jgi:hypothetical protein